MKKLNPGTEVDGFRITDCLHAGGMAHIYAVEYASRARPQRDPGFAMVMKIPRMTPGDGAENIVSFEVELQILPALQGRHVPRFVAAGDLLRLPYLVMEHIPGDTLQRRLDAPERPPLAQCVQWAAAIAEAAHSLHQQNCCHLDLKPANVLLHPDGHAVLLDFGLSCHAHYPDLLAESLRRAVGSAAWMAPEQIVGIRGDVRSDIFAIGVMLYEMVTGHLPFGSPRTDAGLRQRMWLAPTPPRAARPDMPEWLQEIVLRCLEPEAAQRYPSAAHLAFDLRHPEQVPLTARSQRLQGLPWRKRLRHWVRAAGMHYQPSALPRTQVDARPIVMVALPHEDASDATLYALREAAARALGMDPQARLAVVTVISPGASHTVDSARSETTLHRQHLARIKHWAQPLGADLRGVSFHVLEASDVAQALVTYAEGNHVGLMIVGAATHGLHMQRLIATVPMRVVRDAPCSVILVKQHLPFAALQAHDNAVL